MTLFTDTSALYAVLNAGDNNHPEAKRIWSQVIERQETLLVTSYVLVELYDLLASRLGLSAVRAFREAALPILTVHWVDEQLHNAGLSLFTGLARRKLSFVDCVSFEAMRQVGLSRAFAFDRHFREQGFELLG